MPSNLGQWNPEQRRDCLTDRQLARTWQASGDAWIPCSECSLRVGAGGENLRFGHRGGKGLERLQQHIDFALKSLEGISRQLQVCLFG